MNDIGITFLQAWNYGGPLMWVLAGLSVLALALAFYLLVAHRHGAIAPAAFVSDVGKAISAGEFAEVQRLCDSRPNAFGQLVTAMMDAKGPEWRGRPELAKDAIETAGAHVAARLNATADWLADIAALAPLVGLLGTVLGMFQAFGGIASDVAANAKPMVLAQGVSQAIVTTIFGLIVAIPCVVLHAWARRRAAKRIAELENLAVMLEGAL